MFFAVISTVNAQQTPRANARQGVQQGRIAEGSRSGDLSHKEARKLEMQQRHIKRTKRHAKADGVVTPAEKGMINRQQNRANRNIAREKNDQNRY